MVRNFSKPLFKQATNFFLIIIIISSPFILLNIFLSQKKSGIESVLASYTKGDVYIGRMYFVFPNKLVFRDISFGALASKKEESPFFAKTVTLSLSLRDLFLRRKVYVSNVSLESFRLDLSYYMILSVDLKKIIRVLANIIEGKEARISMKHALFILPPYEGVSSAVGLDSNVYVDIRKNIYSEGEITIGHYHNEKYVHSFEPLLYKIKGFLEGEKFSIESLEVSCEQIYAKLWGDINKYIIRLQGMILNNPELASSLKKSPFLKRIQGYWHKQKSSSVSIMGSSKDSFNIYDLYMGLEVLPNKITAKNIDFSLNNIPFHLEGVVSLKDITEIDIMLSSYPRQSFSSKSVNPRKTLFHIKGKHSKGGFNGKILFKFIKRKLTKEVVNSLGIEIANLSLLPLGEKEFNAEFDKAKIEYRTGDDVYNISLSNFHSIINLGDRYLKSVSFNSRIYDGIFKGKGWLDVSSFPFKSFFRANIKGAGAHNLKGVLEYLEKVYGRMDSLLQYKNYPYSKFWGEFTISEGYLDNIIFFNWLAKFFNLPVLRKIYFNSLYSDFYVDEKGSRLENITLKSNDVNLNGYFRISNNDLVSSRISLVFSEKLLNSSAKFKRLLRMLGKENAQKVNFDFQLSGLFNSMNFKWLESDFKNRLKNLMPQGMERAIENRIEKVIESISQREK